MSLLKKKRQPKVDKLHRSNITFAIQVASLLVGVMATGIQDPANYGLSDITVRWISLASGMLSSLLGLLQVQTARAEDKK